MKLLLLHRHSHLAIVICIQVFSTKLEHCLDMSAGFAKMPELEGNPMSVTTIPVSECNTAFSSMLTVMASKEDAKKGNEHHKLESQQCCISIGKDGAMAAWDILFTVDLFCHCLTLFSPMRHDTAAIQRSNQQQVLSPHMLLMPVHLCCLCCVCWCHCCSSVLASLVPIH